MSNVSGSANTSSSRLADEYIIASLSPAAIGTPRISRVGRQRCAGSSAAGRRMPQDLLDRAAGIERRGRRAAARAGRGAPAARAAPTRASSRVGVVAGGDELHEEVAELEVVHRLALDLGGEEQVAEVARLTVVRAPRLARSACRTSPSRRSPRSRRCCSCRSRPGSRRDRSSRVMISAQRLICARSSGGMPISSPNTCDGTSAARSCTNSSSPCSAPRSSSSPQMTRMRSSSSPI